MSILEDTQLTERPRAWAERRIAENMWGLSILLTERPRAWAERGPHEIGDDPPGFGRLRHRLSVLQRRPAAACQLCQDVMGDRLDVGWTALQDRPDNEALELTAGTAAPPGPRALASMSAKLSALADRRAVVEAPWGSRGTA